MNVWRGWFPHETFSVMLDKIRRIFRTNGRCVVILYGDVRCPESGDFSYGGRPHCEEHYRDRMDGARHRLKTPPILMMLPKKRSK